MALYFALGAIDDTRIGCVVPELAHGGKSVIAAAGQPGWIWADDDPVRFGPAFDDATGATALCSGRLSWPSAEWARAARLPYRGGLANRLMLDRFLKRGPSAVAPYNGAAVVVVADAPNRKVHIWTDQFGYHPCFIYRDGRPHGCIVTTSPDALLVDREATVTDDEISMAEFIRAWRVTPPNTYLREVKHAGAAAHIVIDLRTGEVSTETYWRPFQNEFFPSIEAASEELAEAVRVSVEERTAIAKRPLVFISGGSDSRILLFSASKREDVTAVNLYEREARETQVARQLAQAASAKFMAFQRGNDFYPRNLEDSVRWSGGMWSVEDSHYVGFSDDISSVAADLVMTACTTDWLFKGYGLEKKHVSIFGKNLPLLTYVNDRREGFLPNRPLPAPAAMAREIEQRLATWFDGCPAVLTDPWNRLKVEDRRIRPATYTVSVSGPIMYRRFPYDTFLADSRIAECYGRSHPDWKLNRELWGKVAARLCADAGQILDANYGWRVDSGRTEKLIVFGRGWIRRRFDRLRAQTQVDDGLRPPSSGSWPEMGWYATHSETLRSVWNSVTSAERERMAGVCWEDPFSISLNQWALRGNDLFRILTLLVHWRETERRRALRLRAC
jgi:hypothetical protein